MTKPGSNANSSESVLVISTGPISNFVLALGAFSAIRMHHDEAEITLVAQSSVAEFAKAAPYFDDVVTDHGTALSLRSVIRSKPYTVVYDLDTSSKSNRAYFLAKTWRQRFGMAEPVRWSGTATGCALPHTHPERSAMHFSDRLMSQLEAAGLYERPPVSLAWVSRAVGTFTLPISLSEPFVLLAVDPGGAGGVQWTPAQYADVAEVAFVKGERPVLIGETDSPGITEAVQDTVSEVVNLCGRVSYVETVFLAWAANAAIGTDNGLMHLITAAGCASVVLYDPGSDAALMGHRGPDVTILRRHDLAAITVAEVVQALKNRGGSGRTLDL